MDTLNKSEQKNIAEAAKYDWKKGISIDSYIDIKDTNNIWCLGSVIQISQDGYWTVNYDGWYAHWNERLHNQSDRLAPARKYSRGFTGATKKDQRESFKFDAESTKIMLQEMDDLKNNFASYNPELFTFFLRVRLFVMMDSLLVSYYHYDFSQSSALSTYSKNNINKEDEKIIINMCKKFCELYCKWLEQIPSCSVAYSEAQKTPMLQYVSLKAAIACSANEFTETFKLIFGVPRNSRDGEQGIVRIIPAAESLSKQLDKPKNTNSLYGFASWILQEIISNNGLEIIVSLFSNTYNPPIPLKLLLEIVSPYIICDNFAPDLLKPFASRLLTPFENKLKSLSPADLRVADESFISNIFACLKQLTTLCSGSAEKSEAMADDLMIDLGMKLLDSTNITNKMAGINMISLKCKDYSSKENLKEANRIAIDALLKKICEKGFTEKIFEKCKLEEVLVGAKPMLELFFTANSENSKKCFAIVFSQFWKSCVDIEHDEFAKVSLNLLTKIIADSQITKDAMESLYEKLKELPLKYYTENILKLAESHARRAIDSLDSYPKEKYTYNLSIFWNIIQDFATQNDKIKESAMNSLFRLLEKSQDDKKSYVEKAAECLKSSDLRNVELNMKLIKKLNPASLFSHRDFDANDYYEFVEKAKLIETTLKNCAKFHAENKPQEGNQSDVPPPAAFLNGAALYLDFLHFISTGLKKTVMSKDRLEILWKLYFTQSFHESHSKLLFDILIKETTNKSEMYWGSSTKFLGFSIDKEQASLFFKDFICPSWERVSKKNLTLRFFDCYKKYYQYTTFKGSYGSSSESVPEITHEIDLAFNLALDNNFNQRLLIASHEWLVEIFIKCIKIPRLTEKEKFFFVETLIDRSFGFLSSANPDNCKAAFSLLKLFIKSVEQGDWETSIDLNTYESPPLVHFSVKSTFGNTDSMTVLINENLGLPQLKCKLSNMYRVSMDRIIIKNGDFGSSINWDYYKTENLAYFARIYSNLSIELEDELLKDASKPTYVCINKYFDKLMQFLTSSSGELIRETWNFLTLLEPYQKIQNKIKMILEPNFALDERGMTWKNYLDLEAKTTATEDIPQSKLSENAKTAYTFYLLSKFIQEINLKEEGKKFKENFKKYEGFGFLLNTYYGLLPEGKSFIKNKCIIYCVKIFATIMDLAYVEKYLSSTKDQEKMWEGMNELIKLVCEEDDPMDGTGKIDEKEKAEILKVCFSIHKNILIANKEGSAGKKFFTLKILSENYLKMFGFSFLTHGPCQTSQEMINWIETLWNEFIKNEKEDEAIKEFITLLLKLYFDSVLIKAKTIYFFDILSKIICEMKPSLINYFFKEADEKIQLLDKTINCFILFLDNKIESDELEKSCVMIGCMKVLKAIFSIKVEIKIRKKGAVFNALKKLLFGHEHEPQLQNAKLKSPEIRLQAIELAMTIAKGSNCPFDLLKCLMPLHENPQWRTHGLLDWNITPRKVEKSTSGYVGLANLGSTCYLNSFLQQLFMIPQFRNQIIGLNYNDKNPDSNALIQLQQVFASLDDKEFSSYEPKGFCASMGVVFGQQQDVNDFMTILFERLQEEMKNTRLKNLIKEFFEFKTVTEITCTKCNKKKYKPEPSIILALDVKEKKNIIESLKSFTNQETLQGDNAYECSYCREKVIAIKKDILSRLPNYLIISLKRFEKMYSADGFACQKVNSFCEFPMELNLREFTVTDGSIGKLPETFFKYTLRGIIVHNGILQGGHYYSYIEDREKLEFSPDQRWFEFNDSRVNPFDPKKIPEEAFGDPNDRSASKRIDMHSENLMKENNAYILFYERSTFVPEEILNALDNESLAAINDFDDLMGKHNQDKIGLQKQCSHGLQKMINKEKELTCSRNYLMCDDYSRLIAFSVKELGDNQEIVNEDKRKELRDIFLTKYIFTTGLRAKMTNDIRYLLDQFKNSISVDQMLARGILEMFSCKSIIEEFILQCPSIDSRKAVVYILKAAIKCVAEEESQDIKNYILSCKFTDYKELAKFISLQSQSYAEKYPPSAPGHSLILDFPHKLCTKASSKLIIPQIILLADAMIQSIKQFKQYSSNGPQLQLFQILSAIILGTSLGIESKGSFIPEYYIQSLLPTAILEILEFLPTNESIEYISSSLPHFCYSNDKLIVPEMELKIESFISEMSPARNSKEDVYFGLLETFSLLLPDILSRVSGKGLSPSPDKEEKVGTILKKGIETLSSKKGLDLLMKYATSNNGLGMKYANSIIKDLLSCGDKETTAYIIDHFKNSIEKKDFPELPFYLNAYIALISSVPSESESLIKAFFNTMSKEITFGIGHYSAGITLIDSYISLSITNEEFKKIQADYRSDANLESCIRWVERVIDLGNHDFFRDRTNSLSNLSNEAKTIHKKACEERLVILRDLRTGDFGESISLISVFLENIEELIAKIQTNQEFDFYCATEKKWLKGKVVAFTDIAVCFSANNFEYWVDRDFGNIALPNSKTCSKARELEIIMKEIKK